MSHAFSTDYSVIQLIEYI